MAWPRWSLRQLAAAIAALAIGFALLGIELTILASALCSPAILAQPGRRFAAMYWVVIIYPYISILSLYWAWIAGWHALGHPPRPMLDDPKDIAGIDTPYMIAGFLLFNGCGLGWFVAVMYLGVLVARRAKAREGSRRSTVLVGIVLASWFGAFVVTVLDPLGALAWYMD